MSQDDEAGILVLDEQVPRLDEQVPIPKPFDEVSSLFASIDRGYSDEFVEVYAPVVWSTDTDKRRIRRESADKIAGDISEVCKDYYEGPEA